MRIIASSLPCLSLVVACTTSSARTVAAMAMSDPPTSSEASSLLCSIAGATVCSCGRYENDSDVGVSGDGGGSRTSAEEAFSENADDGSDGGNCATTRVMMVLAMACSSANCTERARHSASGDEALYRSA